MKKFLIACVSACLSLSAFAGTSDAKLVCKLPTGQILFQVDLKDMEGNSSGRFTFGHFSLDAASLQTVFDPTNGIFTLQVDGSDNSQYAYGPIKLWGLPTSFHDIQPPFGQDKAHEFNAKLFRGDAKIKDKKGSTIDVICTLEYKR